MNKKLFSGYFIFRCLLTGFLFFGIAIIMEDRLILEAFAESPEIISCHNTKTGDEQKILTVKLDEQIHFSIFTVQATSWEWKVDGLAVANNSFPFLSMEWANIGNHTVEVRASDGAAWTDSIVWNISVSSLTATEMATRFYNPNNETWLGPEWASGGQDDFLL